MSDEGTGSREWEEVLDHRGVRYLLHYRRRPFREGLEVTVIIGGETVKLAEFGFGEEALLEKVRSEIDKRVTCPASAPTKKA